MGDAASAGGGAMISIIVPAHNEEAVIARGLRALTEGAAAGELEVIVACNGCTDRTAEIARSFGGPVRVIEVERASKIAALNAADAVARGFPRFYVDADVVLPLESVRRIAAVLESGKVLFATPELRMDLSRTTWAVRAFYRVWTELPYNREAGAVGTGVYALSRAGRARFGEFPDVIADDGFVRFSFAPEERATVSGAWAFVDAPRTLSGLIRIKTRTRLGQYQLRTSYPTRRSLESKSFGLLLSSILRRPFMWHCLPAYALVNVIARCCARQQVRVTDRVPWARDSSARMLSRGYASRV